MKRDCFSLDVHVVHTQHAEECQHRAQTQSLVFTGRLAFCPENKINLAEQNGPTEKVGCRVSPLLLMEIIRNLLLADRKSVV